jgi:hypothetical protein
MFADHRETAAVALTLALTACGGASAAVPATSDADAAAAPPFVACQVLIADPDAGGLDSVRNYTCADVPDGGVIQIRWGWDGASMAGSCPGDAVAPCVAGSPCTVATPTEYVQGGCLP